MSRKWFKGQKCLLFYKGLKLSFLLKKGWKIKNNILSQIFLFQDSESKHQITTREKQKNEYTYNKNSVIN